MPDTGWHVDKRVSVGHIVTTAVVAVSLTVYLIRIEGRVSLNDSRINMIERQFRDDVGGIKRALIRIEDKLDRKADK